MRKFQDYLGEVLAVHDAPAVDDAVDGRFLHKSQPSLGADQICKIVNRHQVVHHFDLGVETLL